VTDRLSTAEILLPLALPGTYTYAVPEGMAIVPGSYVAVPLGTRTYVGCVWATPGTPDPAIELRSIVYAYDLPAMPAQHRRFIDWIADYYLEPKGNVLRLALRAPGVFEGEREQVAYRVGQAMPSRMTPQRERVLGAARQGGMMRARELADEAGVGLSVVKALAQAGALEPVSLPAHRRFSEARPGAGRLQLSSRQEEAAKALRAAVTQRGPSVTLLDGVTGSGKTEVYFEAMATAIAGGRQVLLLLPEIALTAQFLRRVEERFGAEPAQWHSSVRPRERERAWLAVARREAQIVVGARSALFLPWASLGLIIVDEEHEGAYKQEDGVPYHARDMAIVYGSIARFPVILSSATPSLESLVNVERGRYGHVTLAARHGGAEVPKSEIIDMRTAPLERGAWLSEPLAAAVRETLDAGDQALLFLNRRGYAPLTLCRACGHRFECPNCSASLVEHRFRRQLMCHHCGHVEPVPHVCPACRAEQSLVPCGPGVERLAEEAGRRFPDAKMAILSSDLSRGTLLIDAIRDVESGKFNLVIGTQLVAKGHHFPELTLAGIVDADFALESGDPRTGERTWQLLSQVSGRAGRGEKRGRALIQTYQPAHPLMTALAAGDRDGFIGKEKRVREAGELPPYGRLAAIIISGRDAQETERFARGMAKQLPIGEGIQVLGPAPSPLHLIRGLYRWRFLVKSKREVSVQAYISAWLETIKPKGSLRVAVDIDPYSFL
jgi:primosomal protein N' (replication factor Y)